MRLPQPVNKEINIGLQNCRFACLHIFLSLAHPKQSPLPPSPPPPCSPINSPSLCPHICNLHAVVFIHRQVP